MILRLLYSGFDQFDIAFKGAIPHDVLVSLAAAKETALRTRIPTFVRVGPGAVEMHVKEHGMRGGYAFACETGPTGEQWWFTDSQRAWDWNIFASVHSKGLICSSLADTFHRLKDTLIRMGCNPQGESVNRVDFAMDFLAPGFVLRHEQFVAHRRAKVRPYWSSDQSTDSQPSAVLAGRRCESVTIGKMPGRQIIVYDKRRDTIDKRKSYWPQVWGIDLTDPRNEVWRVEVRAGKQHLKDCWSICTFSELVESIGDVYCCALRDVRYVADVQTDSNVSRQETHEIWQNASETIASRLLEHRSGITPHQMREVERRQAVDMYIQQIVGNAAGLSVALELSDTQTLTTLPSVIAREVQRRMARPTDPLWSGRRRAAERLHFVVRSPNGE